jgi:hypothetical protein
LLANPELDWIGEYLYDFVDTENSVWIEKRSIPKK